MSTKHTKRPAATGLFFDFGDGPSTTTAFIISTNACRRQGMRRTTVVPDRRQRLSLPVERSLQGECGSVVGDELPPDFPGAERKVEGG